MPDETKEFWKHLAEDKQEEANSPKETNEPEEDDDDTDSDGTKEQLPEQTPETQPAAPSHIHDLKEDGAIKISFANENKDDVLYFAIWRARSLASVLNYDPPEDEDTYGALMRLLLIELEIIDVAVNDSCDTCRKTKVNSNK